MSQFVSAPPYSISARSPRTLAKPQNVRCIFLGMTGTGTDIRVTLDAIRRLVRALRSPSRRSEPAAGLKAAERFVLHALREEPVQSLNELAERTYTDQSTASPVVERLRRHGLLRRERSAVDARRVVIALTAAGRAAVGRAPDAPQAAIIAALRRMPPRERHSLRRG